MTDQYTKALCHQNRPLLAKGLCTCCYQRYRKSRAKYPELEEFVVAFKKIKEDRVTETSFRHLERSKNAHQNKEVPNDKWRISRYGITQEELNFLKNKQKGKCHICEKEPKKLYIDHCHSSGKVRKLLCPKCNTLVGYLETSVEILEKAKEYIDEHKC